MLRKLLLIALFWLFSEGSLLHAQNQAVLQKEANTNYLHKDYAAALPAYRQLLAKDQLNPEFNFRYGHCLYEIENKDEAAKYFDLLISRGLPADPLVYYFRAKIYQHQYFFSKAQACYLQYQQLTLQDKNALPIAELLNQCKRGEAEVRAFQTLPVLDQKEVKLAKFYQQYTFAEEGYSIYEAPDFLPKYNAKKGHIPIYCYKRGMKYRIIAAHDDSPNQLELFIQKKDANNNWGAIQKISGVVNSALNESYAFYDEPSQTLYFSSEAGSIGGYDLLKAQLDLQTGVSSELDKLKYPYASPDDDLFYVIDRAQNKIFFTSNRNNSVGNAEIYTLELGKEISAPFIFAGTFKNLANPNQAVASISFESLTTQIEYGPFVSQLDGSYLIALPPDENYTLIVRQEGASSDYHTHFVIPKLTADQLLNQQITFQLNEFGKEQYVVINRILPKDGEQQVDLLAQAQVQLKGQPLKQLQASKSSSTAATRSPLFNQFAWAQTDTIGFVKQITDSLLAAEVSLENQVRLSEVLRKSFEQKLAQRESLLSKGASKELDQLNKELALIKQWLEVNQAANIPNMELLAKIQAVNEKAAEYLHNEQQIELLKSWEAAQLELSQYLQIAAFDGEQALKLAEQDLYLSLQETSKEQVALKEDRSTYQKQLQQLEKNIDLQSKKEQVVTQARIEELKNQILKINNELAELENQRASQAEQLAVFEQPELIEDFVVRSENQALPELEISETLAEMMAQYEQQQKIVFEVQASNQTSSSNQSTSSNQTSSESSSSNQVSNEGNLAITNEKSNENSNGTSNQTRSSNQSTSSNQSSSEENLAITNEGSNENSNGTSNQTRSSNQASSEGNLTRTNEGSNENSNGTLNQSSSEINSSNQLSNETSSSNQASSEGNLTRTNEGSNENSNGTLNQSSSEINSSNQLSNETSSSNQVSSEGNLARTNEGSNENSNGTTNQTNSSNQSSSEENLARTNEGSNVNSNGTSNQTRSSNQASSEGNLARTNETSSSNQASSEGNLARTNEGSNENSNGTTNQTNSSNQSSSEENLARTNEGSNVNSNGTSNQTRSSNQSTSSNQSSSEENLAITNEGSNVNSNGTSNQTRSSNQSTSSNQSSSEENLARTNEGSNVNSNGTLNQSSSEINSSNQSSSENNSSNQALNETNSIREIETTLKAFEEIAQQIAENNTEQIIDIAAFPSLVKDRTELEELEQALALPVAQLEIAPELKAEQWEAYIAYLKARDSLERAKKRYLDWNAQMQALELSYLENPNAETLQQMKDVAQKLQEVASLKALQQGLLEVKDQAQFEALFELGYLPPYELKGIQDNETDRSVFSFNASPVYEQIQIGLPCPQGLVFRVQVGAFRKPIPAGRFTEFKPVDGRILANGLTVVMAGYFKNSAEALVQRDLIRKLGYADAFVVAYNGCERMNMTDAQRLEVAASGGNNKVVQKSIFEGPGTHLYYTVQVGVYNRPLISEKQLGLPELIEAQTAKGQYRYASGRFDNLVAAKERQKLAVKKGITDAFIVAYYQGKRISLAEAKQLQQQGIVMQIQPEKLPDPKPSVLTLTELPQLPVKNKLVPVEEEVRFEKNCFTCQDQLSVLNHYGLFTYLPEMAKISSVQIKESELNTLQRYYLKSFKKVDQKLKGPVQTLTLDPEAVSGAQMDWLLRQNQPYRMLKNNEGKVQIEVQLP